MVHARNPLTVATWTLLRGCKVGIEGGMDSADTVDLAIKIKSQLREEVIRHGS